MHVTNQVFFCFSDELFINYIYLSFKIYFINDTLVIFFLDIIFILHEIILSAENSTDIATTVSLNTGIFNIFTSIYISNICKPRNSKVIIRKKLSSHEYYN